MDGRTTGRRGVAILAVAILAAGALAASTAGAAAPVTKKKVRKIATKVATGLVNQKLEMKVASGPHHSVTTTDYADVTGASATATVPDGRNALIVARFGGSSICAGTSGSCRVRILIGGVVASPEPVSPWDTRTEASSSFDYEALFMERSRTVGPGTYAVQVQAARAATAFFDLDNWHLTVERILV